MINEKSPVGGYFSSYGLYIADLSSLREGLQKGLGVMPQDQPLMQCGHTAQGYTELDGQRIPMCLICMVSTQAEKPSLDGRQARCTCGRMTDSKYSLAFFEYRGEGSKYDKQVCKICGYFQGLHPSQGGTGLDTRGNAIPRLCENDGRGTFTTGPHQYDSYYCGCQGWD